MELKEAKFILGNTYPFNKLKEKELNDFLENGEIKEYKSQEFIYKEKDPPDYFYLILEGKVLVSTNQKGLDIDIELLKRGTSFGIISLFNEEPHSVSTRSVGKTYILRIEKERFRKLLYRYPDISLEFTRILSQRIRARISPKKIFQCKRIAVIGFPNCGKTTYAFNLALQLKEQTNKKVIFVELSYNNIFGLKNLEKNKIFNLERFREEIIFDYIIRKEETDILLVNMENFNNYFSLLNFLSENYHFIICEFAFEIWKNFLEDILNCTDYVHFLSFQKKKNLEEIAIIIKKFEEKNPLNKEKIKIILSEFENYNNLSFEEKKKILEYPIFATLPHYEKKEEYLGTLKRIARYIGEKIVGLVLGSGAAYGFSHIGVLKVLEKNNIPIDIICGSSMGAVVASLWAIGYSIEEIEKFCKEFGKKFSLFSFRGLSFPFRGILKAKYLENVCKKFFGFKTFYEIKHPLKIVAFDFNNKETRVLDDGLIYKALAASCAIPGIFEPVEFKKELLLDGGILNPLPTKVVLNYGANKILAVNITPNKNEILKEYNKRNKLHIFDFIFGSIETMQREFIQQATKIADIVIHPNLEGLNWMEFNKVEEFIKRGEEATLIKIEEIKQVVFS
ncbi:MAG: patatin-like phospholipase family protein [Candidatus Aenigmatarchaeota archaeon]